MTLTSSRILKSILAWERRVALSIGDAVHETDVHGTNQGD